MGPKDFYIELDNPARSYFSGQSMSGRVVVVSGKEIRTDGLRINFKGKATVCWKEWQRVRVPGPAYNHHQNHNHNHNRHHNHRETHIELRTVAYSAVEEYFNFNIFLLGNGGFKVIIPAGRHAYPFQFVLPNGLPSSFKGEHGRVQYLATAILQRSWNFDKKHVLPFTVNGVLDLNHEPAAQIPVNVRNFKNVGFWCCKSGPVGYVFQMSKQGYVPGERIKIMAELNNKSKNKVNNIRMSLIQEVHYHARGKSKMDNRLLVLSLGPFVAPGESEIWKGNVIRIPPVAPTTSLGCCRLIEICYKLKIEMDISGFARNLKSTIPMLIGTIPLESTFEELTYHPNLVNDVSKTDYAVSGPSVGQPPSSYDVPGLKSYPDLPPPTYCEAFTSEKLVSPAGEKVDTKDKFRKIKSNQVGQDNGGATVEEASAPPDEGGNYLPNYITYGGQEPDQRSQHPLMQNSGA